MGGDQEGHADLMKTLEETEDLAREVGSRFPVGSSASTSGGRPTTARAIPTRCCSPPESATGVARSRESRPT
jgi:hypothetical protein